MNDLWPDDLGANKIKAPIIILKEQASLLGTKTHNIVKAEVISSSSSVKDGQFMYGFYIVAPALQNYRYKLFSVSHDIELYPLAIFAEGDLKKELEKYYKKSSPSEEVENESMSVLTTTKRARDVTRMSLNISSEASFIKALQRIFNTNKTKQIIESLLAQSEGYVPDEDDLPF